MHLLWLLFSAKSLYSCLRCYHAVGAISIEFKYSLHNGIFMPCSIAYAGMKKVVKLIETFLKQRNMTTKVCVDRFRVPPTIVIIAPNMHYCIQNAVQFLFDYAIRLVYFCIQFIVLLPFVFPNRFSQLPNLIAWALP